MKMKKERKNSHSYFGWATFLLRYLTTCVTATVSILFGMYVYNATGNVPLTSVLTVLVLAVLAFIFCMASSLRRGAKVEKPVYDIIDATNKITEGNFDIQLPIEHVYSEYDEFDRIKENLNAMTKELSKSEVLKTEFVSNVSHEMKTPLSVIQNYAMALQDQSLDEKTREEYATVILEASKRLTALVTNILKLNKLENSTLEHKKEKFDLSEDIRQLALQYIEKIDEKGLDFEPDIPDEYVINGEKDLLDICITNLLSNAIKFTDKGGITISLKEDTEGRPVISVKDTGCGMNKETGEHIFDKFYQGDTSHSKEGNGLGLALVKRVIATIGGTISVQSEAGVGSTFSITLPEK